MFYVRQKTENLLVLGAPRIQELAGLFLLGLGLLALGLSAAMLFEGEKSQLQLLIPGLILSALGAALVFLDTKLCFDRRGNTFSMERYFGETLTLPLQEIETVSIHRMRDVFQHYEIVMRGGRRICMGVTRFNELDAAAQAIADFAGVPLEVQSFRQDLFPY